MPKTDETLKARAREMRTHQTPAEAKLWRLLRARRCQAVKFTRQVVVAPWVVDFAGRGHGLVIELDGDTHGAQLGYDAARTADLEQRGYRVIRFTNAEAMSNIEGVSEVIAGALSPADSSSPRPSPQRGEEEDSPRPSGERVWRGAGLNDRSRP